MDVTRVVILKECLIPLADKPGRYSAYTSPSKQFIVAVDQHGNVYANGVENVGHAYETFSLSTDGNAALFEETNSPFVLAIPVKDKAK